MAIARRWLSAAAGLILLAMTLSGTVSPYQGEVMRSLKPAAHTRAPVPDRVSLPQAIETIEIDHPGESVVSASRIDDVIEVKTKQTAYTVDPSSGEEIAQVAGPRSWFAALDNLHRCLLSCQGPGHVHWLSQEIPHTGWWGSHRGLTVGGLVVATSGVVLVVLTVSGLRTWWPMQRYRRTALSSHWRTQRLSRDTDLFKAAGLVLLPLLFLWGYYASVFSIRPTQPASPVSMTGYQSLVEPTSTGQDQDIGPHRAVAAAQEAGGGQAVALFLPEPGDPSSTYTIWVSQGERVTPRQSHNSVAVNVDPGTGRATVPSTPALEPTARAG